MKILHVIPGFFPEHVGGTEVYCLALCHGSAAAGISAEVITPGYGRHETSVSEYEGITVTRYAEPTIQSRRHINGGELPLGIPEFLRCVKIINPDCVHVQGIYGGAGITVAHLEAVKQAGFPVIYTMHLPVHVCLAQTVIHNQRELCDGVIRPVRCAACYLVHRGVGPVPASIAAGAGGLMSLAGIDPGRWDSSTGTALGGVARATALKENLRRLAAACDKVVYIAEWFGNVLRKNHFPAARLAFVPAGYSAPETGPELAVAFDGADSVKLLFVGRIVPVKDLKLLLEALAAFPEGAFELSIYGAATDPDYYTICKAIADRLPGIHWRGVFGREAVPAIFRQHHLLCLPSSVCEMAPLVIQEAFASGLPVLASDVYGNREALGDGKKGILFPFKSVAGLQAALRQLLGSPETLDRLKPLMGPPRSFEQVVKGYAGIYREVTAKKLLPHG